jgi:serine/threonine protein kinase
MVDVKLCDFELSKNLVRYKNLYTSTILGTFDFFAPELIDMMAKRMQGKLITQARIIKLMYGPID